MVTLTVEFPFDEDTRETLQHLLRYKESAGSVAPEEPPKAAPAAKKATGAAKKAAAAKADQPAVEPEPDDETARDIAGAPTADEEVDAAEFAKVVKDTVRQASEVLKVEGGDEKIRAALAEVGVERVGRLQNPEQVEQFLALIK